MNNDIEERNKRVEADKAWEVSYTRRALIAVITYVIVCFYLILLNVAYSYLHALVPPMAYIISTISFPFVKRLWLDKAYYRQG